MAEQSDLQQQLMAEVRQKLNERFEMRPNDAYTEAAVRAEGTRLGQEVFGDQLGGIDIAHLYRCPTRDCEFESLDAEATCPLHDRRVYDCGYSLAVHLVPEEIEFTVVKDSDG